MTELRRRLSFGEPPEFSATTAGLASIATCAVSRRRIRAAMTSFTAVALVAALAVGDGTRTGIVGLQPTAPGANPTASAGGETPTQPGGVVSPSPTVELPHLGSPTYTKTPRPSDRPPQETAERHESWPPEPTPEPTHSAAPPIDGVEEWSERVETVDDRPELGCYTPAAEKGGWCWRYTGPQSAPARDPVPFEFELCRRAGVYSERVDLRYDVELHVYLGLRQGAGSADGAVEQPHSRTVVLGTCLRWTALWNGITGTGYRVAPGSYHVRVRVAGVVPYVDLSGQQTTHGYPGDYGKIELT